MISIAPGEVLGGHDGLIPRVAFSPDGQRFAVGDGAGKLVVRSRTGEALASAQSPPPGPHLRPFVSSVAWSLDGRTIATMENHILRLRNADDLALVAEALDTPIGRIAFTGGGAITLADRALSIRSVPTLDEIATVPLDRSGLADFDVSASTADPSSGLVVTCDPGGRESDEDDRTTARGSPQITFFDTSSAALGIAVDVGVLTDDVQLDPWRRCIYSISFEHGTSVWTPEAALVRRWRPYVARAVSGRIPFAEHLAISERYVATMPSMDAATARTIDLWEPTTRAHLASADLPEGERPYWLASSPDGSLIVTPTRVRGHCGEHGLRLWHVGLP